MNNVAKNKPIIKLSKNWKIFLRMLRELKKWIKNSFWSKILIATSIVANILTAYALIIKPYQERTKHESIIHNLENESCDKAMSFYDDLLMDISEKDESYNYALIKEKKGLCHLEDGSEDELNIAILELGEAASIYEGGKGEYDLKYAELRYKIGNAYLHLSEVRSAKDNLLKAKEAILESLTIYNRDKYPLEYARSKMGLSSVYLGLASVEKIRQHFEDSISFAEEALEILTPQDDDPTRYAAAKNILGSACWQYAFLNLFEKYEYKYDTKEKLDKAISAYNEALAVFTLEKYPNDYARTQNNLGTAYWSLSEIEEEGDNLFKAETAFKSALKVQTKDNEPLDYAGTKDNLGSTYLRQYLNSYEQNKVKDAIKEFNEVLEIVNVKEYPLEHARTQNNLGYAYKALAKFSDKEENLRKSNESFEIALTIRTKNEYPMHNSIIERNKR